MKRHILFTILFLINIMSASVILTIENVDTAAGSLEIYMTNPENVGGFQFELFGITILDATTPEGLTVITSSTMVMGFSLSGTSIPAGEGVLTVVSFSDYTGDEICFGTDPVSNILSDVYGSELEAEWGSCYCGAGVDECGICGGDGSSCLKTYDYSLIDINPNSSTYEQNLSPGYFEGQVTLHYFGHQT